MRKGTEEIPLTHLKNMAIERSMNLTTASSIKKELGSNWLKHSLNEKIDNSTLLWYAVLNYENEISTTPLL